MASPVAAAAFVPGQPHLLARKPAPGWRDLADATRALGDKLRAAGVESLMVVSTQWVSVLGLQVQTRPLLEGTRIDENWHSYDFGEIDYRIETDIALTETWGDALRGAGFQVRPVDYDHFPVDTGLVTAMKLLDPAGAWPVAQVSLNLYGSEGSVRQLGAAAVRAAGEVGRKVAVVGISSLSSRPIRSWIEPGEDRIFAPSDDSWNRRILDMLAAGDAEAVFDVREKYVSAAVVDSQFRALSFLHGAINLNRPAEVMAYAPVWGMGAAVLAWNGDGEHLEGEKT